MKKLTIWVRGSTEPLTAVQLSPREITILEALRTGQSNKLIAHHLGIAQSTVKERLAILMRLLDQPNRTALALWAERTPGALDGGLFIDLSAPDHPPEPPAAAAERPKVAA